jgi:Protein of unknown function (DUF3500)
MSSAHTHEPVLKHSFLEPSEHPSRSALRPSPLSELHPNVRAVLENIIAVGNKAFAEEFKGVTTDGTVAPGLFALQKSGVSLQPVIDAGKAFLATLSNDERQVVTLEIDSVNWRRWQNAHPYMFRHGLHLTGMRDASRQAALTLVRESMSASGYTAARNIMKLNEHVRELTGRNEEYGEWHYFLSIFGEPSPETPWGWQIDGHHLIINCFMLGDQMVMTPNFLGSEPVFAESGKYAGTRVLEEEESRGYALMMALAPAQQAVATISTDFPRRLFSVTPWDNKVMKHEGIPFGDLSGKQKELLFDLLQTYVGRIRPGHAEIEMSAVRRHLDQTRFGWIGHCDEANPFYYRVHSPVILIEFDHQSGVAFKGDEPARHHIHTLVRTPNGNDYGRDLLRQHYLQHDHSHPHTPHRLGHE